MHLEEEEGVGFGDTSEVYTQTKELGSAPSQVMQSLPELILPFSLLPSSQLLSNTSPGTEGEMTKARTPGTCSSCTVLTGFCNFDPNKS